jgi:hypothetical protein
LIQLFAEHCGRLIANDDDYGIGEAPPTRRGCTPRFSLGAAPRGDYPRQE